MSGYFDFQLLNKAGEPIGNVTRVATATGIILQSDSRIAPAKIKHLCQIARENPDWPVDITHFDKGYDGHLALVWSARIYYRERNQKNATYTDARTTGLVQ